MGIIDESNADVFGAALTDADAMPGVEACMYKPHGGASIPVDLQVTRHPPETLPESGRGRAWNVTVFLAANASITSVNPNGDRVSVSPTYGGTPQDLSVVEILNQSAAGWTLLLR